MKDASFFVLTSLFARLSGIVGICPIYQIEQTIGEKQKEYIKIASSYTLNDFSKDNFQGDYFVNLDIVTIVDDNAISLKKLSELTNLVQSGLILSPGEPNFHSNEDFNIFSVQIVDSTNFQDRVNTAVLLRKVLTIKFKVSQK
jgi:hypothetical protein